MYNNIYYFRSIQKIGGIEQFFYELAKEYGSNGKKYDLAIVYQHADEKQLERLRKHLRCIKWEEGMKLECHRAFFNFNLDIIDKVKADEYVLVVHGNYHMLRGRPPQHPMIDRVVAVSRDAASAYTELTGIPCEHCYNPLDIEEVKPVVHLLSACRLDDPVKGGERVKKLVDAMDRYCKENDRQYQWTIFTNTIPEFDSPNVCLMKPRIDIRPFIADADIVVQLSDNFEGFCYTAVEAALYGSGKDKPKLLVTPCNVFKEIELDKCAFLFDFDCKNITEAVRWIFESKKETFYFKAPKNHWNQLLYKGKSDYKLEKPKMVKVEVIERFLNAETQAHCEVGDKLFVTEERLKVLLGDNRKQKAYVRVV